MKALGYIRVSTDEQAREGESLANQDLQIARYCELYGFDLIDVIVDEGVSAGIDLERRPGGAQLLERLRDGEGEGVVVQRIDRLTRQTIDGLMTAAWFVRKGIALHSVNERIDTGTPDGWLQLTILLATAEYERNKIRQRAVETAEGLLARGKAYGPTPFGCVRVGDRLYRDPDTWGVREEILRLRAQELSLRAICAELRERRIAAPGGGRSWHVSTLLGILRTHSALEHIPWLGADDEAPVSLRAVS